MASETCVYPTCKNIVDSAAEGRVAQWCKEHLDEHCHMPPCTDLLIPRSAFCQVHNDQAVFLEIMHRDWHLRAMQEAQRQAQYQGLIKQIAGKQNGQSGPGGLHIARG